MIIRRLLHNDTQLKFMYSFLNMFFVSGNKDLNSTFSKSLCWIFVYAIILQHSLFLPILEVSVKLKDEMTGF